MVKTLNYRLKTAGKGRWPPSCWRNCTIRWLPPLHQLFKTVYQIYVFSPIKSWCELSLWADGCKYIKFKIRNSRWCEQIYKSYDMFFWLDEQTTTLKTRLPLQIAAFCEIHLLLVFFNSCLKLAVPRNTQPANSLTKITAENKHWMGANLVPETLFCKFEYVLEEH